MTTVVNGKITMYEVRDRNDEETTSGYMDDYEEAKTYAESIGGILMEHTFTWNDSSLDTDFRAECTGCEAPITDNNELTDETHDNIIALDSDIDTTDLCEACALVIFNTLDSSTKENN